MNFGVLIVESDLHRRITVIGIVPKILSGIQEFGCGRRSIYHIPNVHIGGLQYMDIGNLPDVFDVHFIGLSVSPPQLNEFWPVIAFAIVFGTFWCVSAVRPVPGLF